MIREEMLERMSAEEFGGWLALLRLDSQPSEVAESAKAMPRQQTPAEMKAVLLSLAPKKMRHARRNH